MQPTRTAEIDLGSAFYVFVIAIFVFIGYLGYRNGWDRSYSIPIPFLTGPSRADIQNALRNLCTDEQCKKELEIVARFPQVKRDRIRDRACDCRDDTLLYPIRVKGRFGSLNSSTEILAFYFYKDEWEQWHACSDDASLTSTSTPVPKFIPKPGQPIYKERATGKFYVRDPQGNKIYSDAKGQPF